MTVTCPLWKEAAELCNGCSYARSYGGRTGRSRARKIKPHAGIWCNHRRGKKRIWYGLRAELKQLRAMKKLDETHAVDIVRTFLGPHSVLPEWKGKEREFLEEQLQVVMPKVKEENLAEFADIFTEKNVFNIEDSEYYLRKAKEMGFKLKIHADEIYQLGGAELASRVGAVSADHLFKASDEGIHQMRDAGVISTLLPATAFCLKEEDLRRAEK